MKFHNTIFTSYIDFIHTNILLRIMIKIYFFSIYFFFLYFFCFNQTDLRVLKLKVKDVMRELMISKKQGSQTNDLKREVFRLQKDLLQEKTKVSVSNYKCIISLFLNKLLLVNLILYVLTFIENYIIFSNYYFQVSVSNYDGTFSIFESMYIDGIAIKIGKKF